MLSQPYPFSLGHGVVTESIFARKPCTLQVLQTLPQLACARTFPLAFCYFVRQGDSKPQTVLPVMNLRISDEPVPVHVNMSQCQPRQPFSNSCIKVRLV